MKDYLSLFQQTENSDVKVPGDLPAKRAKPGFARFAGTSDVGFQTEIPITGQNAESGDWKADCAELFAEAHAKVESNLVNGACPDCGGGLAARWCGRAEIYRRDDAKLLYQRRQLLGKETEQHAKTLHTRD